MKQLCWHILFYVKIVLFAMTLTLLAVPRADAQEVVILATKFDNESPIIGAIAQQYLESQGIQTKYYPRMGSSRLVFETLLAGEIDICPEYTGTLTQELLSSEDFHNLDELNAYLNERGLAMTSSLGYSSNFGLAMRRENAQRLGIMRISQLAEHPDLKYTLSTEFMGRADGWHNLAQLYHLSEDHITTLDKALAYKALNSGRSDVTEVYTTDAEIIINDLIVLEDNLNYFADYQAVYLYRQDLAAKSPAAVTYLQQLSHQFDVQQVQAMNASFYSGSSVESISAQFLHENLAIEHPVVNHSRWQELFRLTQEHLLLVTIPLLLGFVTSMLLAVIAYWWPKIGSVIIGMISVVQTIPSLALLVFMIPLFGIGTLPAVIALLLYSLLPMVRSTLLGFQNIEDKFKDTAKAMGLSPYFRLWQIDLPLALPAIIDGTRTACILLIGFATLGAIIGAGGYGQAILAGINLNQLSLILLGAIPSALMALCAQALFFGLECIMVSRGLRLHLNNSK